MKISPYYFKHESQDLTDFKDEVSTVLNFGKYQTKVLYEGTPTWDGKEGESVWCYVSSSPGMYEFYQYFFVNSGWRWTIAVGNT